MVRALKLDEQVKRVWTIDGSFHCIVMERGGEEEAQIPIRPLQTWLVRAEDGELWPLLPPLGTVLPFNFSQVHISSTRQGSTGVRSTTTTMSDVLRHLLTCRDGIDDLDYCNYDEITLIIDELCTN